LFLHNANKLQPQNPFSGSPPGIAKFSIAHGYRIGR
jgi:hypothetical protein